MNDRRSLLALCAAATVIIVFLFIRLLEERGSVHSQSSITPERPRQRVPDAHQIVTRAPDPDQRDTARRDLTIERTEPKEGKRAVSRNLDTKMSRSDTPTAPVRHSVATSQGGTVTFDGLDWRILEDCTGYNDGVRPSGFETPSPDRLLAFRKDAQVKRLFPFLFERDVKVWSSETLQIAGRRRVVFMSNGVVESQDEELPACTVVVRSAM